MTGVREARRRGDGMPTGVVNAVASLARIVNNQDNPLIGPHGRR